MRKLFLFTSFLCLVLLFLLVLHLEKVYIFKEKLPAAKPIKSVSQEKGSDTAKNQTKPWLIIYWSTFFGRRLDINFSWKKGECPVQCEATSDTSRASEASAFVVHARDLMWPPNKAVPWILATRENPVYTPALTNPNVMSRFQLLMSYRLDSDFPNPGFEIPELTPPLPFKEKTGLVMAALSNCESVRIEYMRQLTKFMKVDSYGACLHNKDGLIGRYGKVKGQYAFKELKQKLARTYKFLLVFFNQDCDYFVDDQLSSGLDAGTVPVVLGTDKVDDFLPGNLKNSIIRVRNFKSPKQLADYLTYLSNNETAYNEYLEWKSKGVGNFSGTVIGDRWQPKYPLYCQMCVAVAEGKIHKDGLKTDICQSRKYADWGITKGA